MTFKAYTTEEIQAMASYGLATETEHRLIATVKCLEATLAKWQEFNHNATAKLDAATARAEELERERDDLLARLNEVVHQHLDTMVERDEAKADRDRLAAEVERAKGLLADAREHVSFRKHLCPSVEAGPLLWSINDFLTHRQEGNAGAEDDKIEDSSPGGEREAFEAWWCDRCGCDELDTLKSRLAEVEARAEELAGKLGDAAHRMERGKDLLERIRAQLPPMNPDEPKTVVRRVREVVADRDRLAAEVERAKVLLGRVELRDGQKMAGVREDIDAWFTQRQEGNAGAEDDKIEDSSPGGERESFMRWVTEEYDTLGDGMLIHSWDWDEGYPIIQHDHHVGEVHLDDEWAAWQARARAAPAGASEVRRLLDLFRDLVDGSEGVAGWHRNGDVAGWDEIECDLVDKLDEVLALLGKE